MKVSRRSVLGNSCAAAQATPANSGRTYKIIYNWDGAPHDYSEYPQSLEQFLAKVYAPMKDTQVGTHIWCIGADMAEWPSHTLEMVGGSCARPAYEGADRGPER